MQEGTLHNLTFTLRCEAPGVKGVKVEYQRKLYALQICVSLSHLRKDNVAAIKMTPAA